MAYTSNHDGDGSPGRVDWGYERRTLVLVSGELGSVTRLAAGEPATLKSKTVLLWTCGSNLSRLLTSALTPE
jgi:hypothetical protein